MENEVQFLLYSMPDEQGKVQVIVKDGTIWCTQKAMAQLFGVEVNTINYHLKEIYSTKELTEEATIRKIRIVQKEGNRSVERERAFYSLDAIISVGCQFHQSNKVPPVGNVGVEGIHHKGVCP